jgi:hypothetical protein
VNIFFLSDCPEKSAKLLCNRHKVRMPLESAGMLAFAFPEGETPIPNLRSNRHHKHPASVWARQSKSNFEWLLIHALTQAEDYKKHYKREHASEKHIHWFKNNYHKISFPRAELTSFSRCFSSFKEYLDNTESNTIKAYQSFYWLDKKTFAKWPSLEEIPDFWPEKSVDFVDKNFKNGKYIKR